MACKGRLRKEGSVAICTFVVLLVRMTVRVSAVMIYVHESFTTKFAKKLVVPFMDINVHFQIINVSELFSAVGFGAHNLLLLCFTLKSISNIGNNRRNKYP